ncbi:uncharacterized protein LOC107039051 [Diachasma alloeum]|uniref:uncharacterized protein LOC107039051 n=1 Tax=Diachasma alloeum TaxID=454923 RepID=UPI00073817BF|nr:uncharacterized protein LOC107039051 [Diachasma alloeum]
MFKQIELLKLQGVLEHPKREGPSFISRVFLVIKRNGDFRPIFDLRDLNAHVQIKKFQLISHHHIPEFLQGYDFMTRIDISQGYVHVLIAESHRQFVLLVYNEELLQMTSLPCSLSSAPHTFAMISNWVAEIFRLRGMRVIVYLDDFLLACQSHSRLVSQTQGTVDLLTHLGWIVNLDKCSLSSNQRTDFLGFTWDTQLNQVSLPEKGISQIETIISSLRLSRKASLKQTQCLLDSLNFANFAVHRGRLHCRHTQRFLTEFRQKRQRKTLQIPRSVDSELGWCLSAMKSSSDLHKRKIMDSLTTDGVGTGWGAQLNSTLISGDWSEYQKRWHSNRKEMFAVYAVIKQESESLRGSHILQQTESRTLSTYVRKEGRMKSLDLLNLTYKLSERIDDLQIEISDTYLLFSESSIAEGISPGVAVAATGNEQGVEEVGSSRCRSVRFKLIRHRTPVGFHGV